MMFFFVSNGVVSLEQQWIVGFAATSIVGLIFCVNMMALVYLTLNRVKTWCRVRKLKRKVADFSKARLNQKRLKVVNEANHEISLDNEAVPAEAMHTNYIGSAVTNQPLQEDAGSAAKLIPKFIELETVIILEEESAKLSARF